MKHKVKHLKELAELIRKRLDKVYSHKPETRCEYRDGYIQALGDVLKSLPRVKKT